MISSKKWIQYLNQLSLKWVLASSGTSFLLASGTSMVSAYYLMPKNVAVRKLVGSAKPKLQVDNFQNKKLFTEEDQEVILKRNIFNHEGKFGDGGDQAKEGKETIARGKLVKTTLPLKLVGVIFGGDPSNGLAMIENTSKRRINNYMVGDVLEKNAKLIEIYPDRVIFERGEHLEFLDLEVQEIVRSKRRRKGKKSPSKRGGIAPLAKGPPPDAYKEAGFERKGQDIVLTETFKRDLLTGSKFTKVLQDAKAEPNMVNGELQGFRLTRIREDSIYQKAGFQSGDVIQEINGVPLRDAAGAIRLLQQLRNEKEIEVGVTRGGSSFNMNISIQ